MRTAPVPNLPPIPGMCPGTALAGGGAGDAGGSGKGKGEGGEGAGGGPENGGEDAAGDEKGAPGVEGNPKCGTKSHPVDVVTGRAFTHPILDFELPGPLPFRMTRVCSSKVAKYDAGLGYGWSHTLSFRIELYRRHLRVYTDEGTLLDFKIPAVGQSVRGPFGWVVSRDSPGQFTLDRDDGLFRQFAQSPSDERLFRLSAIRDACNNAITLQYQGDQLFQITDSVGRTIRVRHDRNGHVEAYEVRPTPTARWIPLVTYQIDAAGHLVSATDADGFSWSYQYDSEHRLILDRDRAGLCFHFVYDRAGRCIESYGNYGNQPDKSLSPSLPKTLGDGKTKAKGVHHCVFHYYDDGLTEVVDSTHVGSFFGNKRGTLDKEVDGPGVNSYKYDARGHLIAEIDAVGAITTYERDERGRLLSETDPLGRVTKYELDDSGFVVKLTDPAGGVTRVDRDRHGLPEIVTNTTNAVTSYRYDSRGMRVEITHEQGGTTRFSYDSHSNVVGVTLPTGGEWLYTYDSLGRRLTETDPTGAETRYVYSARGDLIATHDAAGGVAYFTYDGEGHLVESTDPARRTTYYEWGGYHKLAAQRDALGHTISFRYNYEGELLEVENQAGEVHRMERNAFGFLTAEYAFDGRVTRYKYDLCNRPVRIERGDGKKKEITEITYDLAGQLIAKELPDGSKSVFSYDLRGYLVSAKNEVSETIYERDSEGRVLREIQKVGDQEHIIETQWDSGGDRRYRKVLERSKLAPEARVSLLEEIQRDAFGHRTMTRWDDREEVTHQRDLLGREVRRTLLDGGLIDSAYDALGFLAERRVMGDKTSSRDGITVHKSYEHDSAGNLTHATSRKHGTKRYEYDPAGQLLAVLGERTSERFWYDQRGNHHESVREIPKPSATDYVSNASSGRVIGKGGQVERRDGVDYVWDNYGRLSQRRAPDGGTTKYRWAGSGLLAAVEQPDGGRVEFVYDALARRVGKKVWTANAQGVVTHEATTHYVWDEDLLVQSIKKKAQAQGDPIVEARTYVYDEDSYVPLAQRDGVFAEGQWRHLVNDMLGSPEQLVDPRGELTGEVRRSAWGQPQQEPSSQLSTDLGAPGELFDGETGLFYNRHRYYSPELGGFLSSDPIGLNGGIHAYAYPGPRTREVDPLGLGPSLEEIRANYNAEVTAIESQAQKRICDGESPADAARWAVDERKRIGAKYKHQTPLHKRLAIYVRNKAPKWLGGKGYASIYGPSYEQQMRKYKNDPHAVISAASRPNAEINKKYGVH